ncbi:MAG: ABC transporter substrate-binding protein [Methanothrix sp.]|jgi:iron complex transport system substrate-binding protein|nr:ABC transporter substrate-binding protein [Methanothrix sp.]
MRTNLNLVAILVLCAIALPIASGSAYVLHIFGNANMDGIVDQSDIVFLKAIIEGKEKSTELADANIDGKVDAKDITQVVKIINETESNLSILDGNNLPITIKKPVERIVVEYLDNADLVQILKKTDKVVGVDLAVAKSPAEFPALSGRTSVGAMHKEPDYEKVLSLNPDILLVFSNITAEKKKNLPGVSVLFAGLYYPDLLNPETSAFTDAVRKLGYVLDARQDAEEYIQWHIDSLNKLKETTGKIPDNEKPTVLVAAYPEADEKTIFTFAKIDTLSSMVELAGGNTVAANLPDFMKSAYRIEVDPEWVLQEDPEYIILLVVATTYSGLVLDPPSGYDADNPTGMKEALEAFMDRPEYANLTAVRNGHVYIVSGNMRNDASKGLIGAAYLAKIFHPDEVELDPEDLHQEYLQRFLGLDYDLDQHGVFIYPPLIKGQGKLAGVPDSYYEMTAKNTTARA